MSKEHIVYCHTNLINDFKYIGQAYGNPERRWKKGKGYISKKLNKKSFGQAILDYGWDNFLHEVLENNLSQEEANQREQYWISYYHTFIGDPECKGYNLTKGGGHTERGKKSQTSNLSIYLPDEMKEKLEEIAKEDERSVSYVIKKAIEYYFDTCIEKCEKEE